MNKINWMKASSDHEMNTFITKQIPNSGVIGRYINSLRPSDAYKHQ